MSVEYQVQMVYRQEDVAALVKVLEFRRRPEKNLRLARKIGYPIFGCTSNVNPADSFSGKSLIVTSTGNVSP